MDFEFLLPLRGAPMLDEVALVARWYNEHRPHRRFDGATPSEVRAEQTPAIEQPRFETRARFRTQHDLRAQRGVGLELAVDYLQGRRHLPIVSLRRAA